MKQHRLVLTAAATLPAFAAASTSATHLFSPSLQLAARRHRPLAFSQAGAAAPSSYRYSGSKTKQCHHRRPRRLTSCVSSVMPLLSCPREDGGRNKHGSSFTLFAISDNSNSDDDDEISAENDHHGETTSRDENTSNKGNTTTPSQEVADMKNSVVSSAALPPPRFLALGYNMAAFLNILSALILIWNIKAVAITTSATATLSSTTSTTAALEAAASATEAANFLTSARYQPKLLAKYTAGSLGYLLLAAGSCNILSEAAKTKRLQTSNTYKRLTMGTLLFGLLGLFSLPGEAGCIMGCDASSSTMVGAAFVMTQLAKFVTAFVSFVGWEYSVGGFGSSSLQRLKNIIGEIGSACQSLYRTYPVTEERPATFYRTFFIFATLGNILFNIPELSFNLKQGGGGIGGLFSLPVSLTISSMARLGLLSVVLYVLKDAAERKRLEGTTFVKLNMMVGLWAIGVGIAQGLVDGPMMPFNLRRAADKFLFGLLFLNNGVLSQLSKMGIIKKRDEEDDDPDADPPLRVVF